MNLLVTGGCGFIGSNFINYIIQTYPDYVIYNIDALYYAGNELNVSQNVRDSNRYFFIKGNIGDKKLVTDVIQDFNIDQIINFAAQSHVDASFGSPLQFTFDNIVGTHTLLECCRTIGKNIKFVHISTDEIYGESQIGSDCVPKNENDNYNPTNPYSATKAAIEMILKSYVQSFDMNIVMTRCNNVYGFGQYPEKLIPKFVKLISEGKKCTIHGTGTNLRAFLHVDDFVKACDLVRLEAKKGEIFNVGSSDEKSIKAVADTIIKILLGNDVNCDDFIEYVEDRNFNDKRYHINCDKIKNILGWKQELFFDDSIGHIVKGYFSTFSS